MEDETERDLPRARTVAALELKACKHRIIETEHGKKASKGKSLLVFTFPNGDASQNDWPALRRYLK